MAIGAVPVGGYLGGTQATDPSIKLSRFWNDCTPIVQPDTGFFFMDDFKNFSQHVSDQDVQQYSSYIDTGVTIKQLATDREGVIEVAGNDADNDEGSISTGGNSGVLGVISDAAADARKLWFECRVKKASIADNALAFFVGLSEEGLAAADSLVDDTGALASKDFIGFQTLHAAGELVDFVYRKAGQAVQQKIAGVHTLVAATFVKLGFKYDPSARTDKRIKVYVNGKEQTTYVTGTNIAAATFPDGEELALLLGTKVGAAAESKGQADWWAFGQLA